MGGRMLFLLCCAGVNESVLANRSDPDAPSPLPSLSASTSPPPSSIASMVANHSEASDARVAPDASFPPQGGKRIKQRWRVEPKLSLNPLRLFDINGHYSRETDEFIPLPPTLPVHHGIGENTVHPGIGENTERSLECLRRRRQQAALSYSDWLATGQRRLVENVCRFDMEVAFQLFGLFWEVRGQRDAIIKLSTRVDNLSTRVDNLSTRVDNLTDEVREVKSEVREVRNLLLVLMAIIVIISTVVLYKFCRPNAPVPLILTPTLTPSRCRRLVLACGSSTARHLVELGRAQKQLTRGPAPSAIPFPTI